MSGGKESQGLQRVYRAINPFITDTGFNRVPCGVCPVRILFIFSYCSQFLACVFSRGCEIFCYIIINSLSLLTVLSTSFKWVFIHSVNAATCYVLSIPVIQLPLYCQLVAIVQRNTACIAIESLCGE